MTHTTRRKLSDDELVHLIETGALNVVGVYSREDDIGAIDRAYAEVRAAATDDERAAARERLDAAVIDAARRGVDWISIAAGLDQVMDPQAVRARYEDRV